MIEIVFAIVMYFIFIGFLVYIGKKNKTFNDLSDGKKKIEFNHLPFERTRSFFDFGLMGSDIDCGYSKTIDDLPDENLRKKG